MKNKKKYLEKMYFVYSKDDNTIFPFNNTSFLHYIMYNILYLIHINIYLYPLVYHIIIFTFIKKKEYILFYG